MFRDGLIRLAGLTLATYGVIGLFVAGVLVLVGTSAFREVERAQAELDAERVRLVQGLERVSETFAATAEATTSFEGSLVGARASAEGAAALARDSAANFREVAQAVQLVVFGVQPLGGLAPGFTQMAEQMDQMGTTLSVTGDLLQQNATDVRRVSQDLEQVRDEVGRLAETVDRAGLLLAASQEGLMPFRLAYYGICLLIGMQSLFSLIGGFAVARYLGTRRAMRARALGDEQTVTALRETAAGDSAQRGTQLHV